MTHITEPRVIGNHADMGRSIPESSRTPVTVRDILRAGIRRRAARKDMATAESVWDSEGGATERKAPDGHGHS